MFTRIDHIGIAVDDLDAAIALHEQTYGMQLVHREVVHDQGVEAVLLDVGESHIELLRAIDEETPVSRFLAEHGPGLHHLAYGVPDIEAALAELVAKGVRLLDQQPRTGIRGSRVAFLQPRTSGRLLTEIVEPAHGH